jgi:hypothetical protein
MQTLEITSTIADHDPRTSLLQSNGLHGLFLLTDEGQLLELIAESIAQGIPFEQLWHDSRRQFASFVGARVTVRGYLTSDTLYNAKGPDITASDILPSDIAATELP